MVELTEISLDTYSYNEFINITSLIEETVRSSKIRNGIVCVMTMHTTTGIIMNEALECLIKDIDEMLTRLIPEEYPYNHSRMLHSYGTTAGNPTGHLKAILTGGHIVLPIVEGRIMKGAAQEVFFCEYDGAQNRKFAIQIIGDTY